MATITVQLQVAQTVATLDGPTIAAVIAWVNANIIQKLPTGATVNQQTYTIQT